MPRTAARHIEALDLFVDVLAKLDAERATEEFYSGLCDAICRLTSLERAVIFRYDDARRRVHAAGTHNLDKEVFADEHVSLEDAPIARTALAEDRVVEAAGDLDEALAPSFADRLRGRELVCAPMSAGGRWVGVVIGDRPPGSPPLSDDERDLLWTLGKTAALASSARIATRQAEQMHQLQGRIDMARDIHDGVIQRLFGVSMALATEGGLTPEAQQRCAAEVQLALSDLRDALQRPLGRESRPTQTSLSEEIDRLRYTHRDLGIVLEGDGPVAVPPHLEPLAQSVLAEAVRNAHKHAEPTRVAVRVGREDGAFVLAVTNDGVAGRPRQTGMGLRLAALEALQVGGVLEFGPRGDGAWQVKLVVPDDAA
ncbi:MAG: GAF domain-containing protein [Solirubrobacterales bacterium]|nr:GAF domain-containing protein [Solirubrobacterales bacterium]